MAFADREIFEDATNPVAVKAVPFYQMKVDVVDYIKEVAIAHPTLTWSASITGPFYDWVSIHQNSDLDTIRKDRAHPRISVSQAGRLRLRPRQ